MTFANEKILFINLSDKTHRYESVPEDILQTWIGGKGLAGYYLNPYITRDWEDPEMPILFMTGPLVGTSSPTSGRMCVMTRSPLTGTVGDCSVGGSLGTQIRKAGLLGIVITGISQNLAGIEIEDDSIKIIDAVQLAGEDTGRLHRQLKSKGAVTAIGPAAENGVRFSSIMIDGKFTAGRNGLGLVLGRKKLKYMTVKGSHSIAVADPEALKKARKDIFRQIAASPVLLGKHGLAHFGTGALFDLMHSRRMMPTGNFSRTRFEDAPGLNAYAINRKYQPRRTGCKGCHILCKKVTKDGVHLPEFETMSHFTALLENTDIDVVVKANTLCNEKGMDTISAGATLACYAEISGERLTGERILSLLEEIGSGTGIGAELGQGSYQYAENRGRPELSFSVKKQELPAYDPRGAYGMALAYSTSTRGGCHLRAYPISHEILRKPVATDRFSFAGKARIIKISEDLNAVVDSLTACKFVFFATSLEEYAKVYTAVTGLETTAQDLLSIGERIYFHERILNARNGFSSREDDLPPRFFNESGSSGAGIEIKPLDRKAFLEARENYYRIRGLDQQGIPTREKAAELGLDLGTNDEEAINYP